MAAAKKRELFEVFQPSDREPHKEDATPAPSPHPKPPPPAPTTSFPHRKTLWEEVTSSASDRFTFSLSRGVVLFAAIVFVLLIAIAYALGQRSGRHSAAPAGETVMGDILPADLAATPSPVAASEVLPTISAMEAGYVVQLISYGKRTKSGMADDLINALRQAGIRTFTTESETAIGVGVGVYPTREQAEEAKKWFLTNEVSGIGPFPDAQIREYKKEE